MVKALRWLLVPLLLCGAQAAEAAETKRPARESVFVAPIKVKGKLEGYQLDELKRRLKTGLSRGFAIAKPKKNSRCKTPRCHVEALGADYLLVTELTVRGRDYRLRLKLSDPSMAEPLVSGEELCELCGLAEVGNLLEHQAAALHEGLASARLSAPFLRVRSHPKGATVRIDGTLVGAAPVERTVEPGAHEVEVSLDGYVKQIRRIQSVVGLRESIEIRLSKLPRYDAKARRMRGFAWANMSLAALTLGAGVTLLALEERPNRSLCSGPDIDADGDCRYRFATKEAGIAVSVSAAAPLIAGTVLFIVLRKRQTRSSPTARLRPAPRLSAQGLAFSF